MTQVRRLKGLSKAVARPIAAGGPRARRRKIVIRLLFALVALLTAPGAELLVAAFTASPPQPTRPIAGTSPVGPSPADVRSSRTPPSHGVPHAPSGQARAALPGAALARSEPVRVTLSKIGVDAEIIPLGVDEGGMLEVPSLERPELTGWYRLGPTPGEVGNAVIVGHVDSHKTGPAVFYRLGALQPGDTVAVARRDTIVAQFTVDKVESYPKESFPTELVYGPGRKPGLRLVTCGGEFDKETHSYMNNTIVFATLTSWRKG